MLIMHIQVHKSCDINYQHVTASTIKHHDQETKKTHLQSHTKPLELSLKQAVLPSAVIEFSVLNQVLPQSPVYQYADSIHNKKSSNNRLIWCQLSILPTEPGCYQLRVAIATENDERKQYRDPI